MQSSPEVAAAIADVRSDSTPADICMFGYEGKTKIVLKYSGKDGLAGLKANISDSEVHFCLLRLVTGDQESKRVKFVYITHIGQSVGGVAKGRAAAHRADVERLLGQSHLSFQTDDVDDLDEAAIKDQLLKSAGANYDLGSNSAGYSTNAGGIKAQASSNYKTLEKESNIGPIIFNDKPLAKETPIDLSGRPMVAPSAAAKANIVMDSEFLGSKPRATEA